MRLRSLHEDSFPGTSGALMGFQWLRRQYTSGFTACVLSLASVVSGWRRGMRWCWRGFLAYRPPVKPGDCSSRTPLPVGSGYILAIRGFCEYSEGRGEIGLQIYWVWNVAYTQMAEMGFAFNLGASFSKSLIWWCRQRLFPSNLETLDFLRELTMSKVAFFLLVKLE